MTAFRTLCGAVVGAVIFAAAPAAVAQTWPTRSIQTISAVSAGNAGDIVARIVLDQVSKQIGQAFVLENRPGAGGTLGTAARRQGRAGRLHGAAADVVAVVLRRDAQEPALRSVPRFRAGRDVRRAAERAGGRAVEGLEDRWPT